MKQLYGYFVISLICGNSHHIRSMNMEISYQEPSLSTIPQEIFEAIFTKLPIKTYLDGLQVIKLRQVCSGWCAFLSNNFIVNCFKSDRSTRLIDEFFFIMLKKDKRIANVPIISDHHSKEESAKLQMDFFNLMLAQLDLSNHEVLDFLVRYCSPAILLKIVSPEYHDTLDAIYLFEALIKKDNFIVWAYGNVACGQGGPPEIQQVPAKTGFELLFRLCIKQGATVEALGDIVIKQEDENREKFCKKYPDLALLFEPRIRKYIHYFFEFKNQRNALDLRPEKREKFEQLFKERSHLKRLCETCEEKVIEDFVNVFGALHIMLYHYAACLFLRDNDKRYMAPPIRSRKSIEIVSKFLGTIANT